MSRSQVAPHAPTVSGIGQRLRQVAAEMGLKLPLQLLQDQGAFDGAWAVRACRRLRVDPRWLLLGVRSRAAESAIRHVTINTRRAFGDDDELIPLLEMLPETMIVGGVCRYCLCSDQYACPQGCSWLDAEHTICSACLEESR